MLLSEISIFYDIINDKKYILQMLQIFIAGILHGLGFAPFNNIFAAIISIILLFHVIKNVKIRNK